MRAWRGAGFHTHRTGPWGSLPSVSSPCEKASAATKILLDAAWADSIYRRLGVLS